MVQMGFDLDELPPAPQVVNDLRYYQEQASDACVRELKSNDSTLVLMATGLGKTQIFCDLARRNDGKTLILAHRDELVEQARARLELMTGEMVDTEQAGRWSSDNSKYVVGSIQSFDERRLQRLGNDRFDLVIVDECHHALARTYRKAIEYFQCQRVGVTATADRTDEKALGQMFDSVAFVMDIEEGINAGYLVPVKFRQITMGEIDLTSVKKTGKDFAVGQLDSEVTKATKAIIQKTLELEPARKAILFFPGVKSAELAMFELNKLRPDSACFISGKTPDEERRMLVRDFKAGRYQYLCNCMIATEGFDAPDADMIVLARPTLSRSLSAQMVGRGTRVLPGVVDDCDGPDRAQERCERVARSQKPNVVVLDFVGNSRHELVSPLDALAGNYSPAEVKKAKEKAKGEGNDDVLALLREARAELKRLAQDFTVRVQARVVDFDPFKVLHVNAPDSDRYAARFGKAPATEKQLGALRQAGVEDGDLKDLSKQAASKLMSTIVLRRQHGLCTYKMLRQLQRYGVNETRVTFAKASEVLDYISSTGWGKRKDIDPARVDAILGRERQPGDD